MNLESNMKQAVLPIGVKRRANPEYDLYGHGAPCPFLFNVNQARTLIQNHASVTDLALYQW